MDRPWLSYLAVVTFDQCLEHFPGLFQFRRAVLGQTISLLSCVGRHWPHVHQDCLPECSLAHVRDKVKLLYISASFDFLLLLVAYSVADFQFWIE